MCFIFVPAHVFRFVRFTCNELSCSMLRFLVTFLTDDTSRQITALAVLVASMTCIAEKDTDPLCYLYQ